MKKLPGVESVGVSLNDGKALVKLRPGNNVRLQEVLQKIRDKAFTPKSAHIIVRGQLMDGRLRLEVIGTGEVFDLTASPPADAALKQNGNKAVDVEGTLTFAKDGKAAGPLEVEALKP
jgi:hypothetical protein